MFHTSREELIKSMTILQRSVCCYDTYVFRPDAPPPEFCDCKYGATNFKADRAFGGEQTFCPELRCVVQLLENINNKEYHYIMGRKNIEKIGESHEQ